MCVSCCGEIDIVGLHIFDGNVGDLYLVDSAFHEAGLGYHNPVATVLKKILRAALVAGIVFPNVPANIVFVSPCCGATLKKELNARIKDVESIVDKFYPDTHILLLFNEDFSETVYKPLLDRVEKLNNDNDLFICCMKLSQVAEVFINGTIKAESIKETKRTPRGGNKKIVLDILNPLETGNYLTDELIDKLCNADYAKKTFGLPAFPALIPAEDFSERGYQECRYYSPELIVIKGRKYKVCSQWIPERMRLFVQWAKENSKCGENVQ